MATFHDRTIAPKFQRGLLRSAGTPCRVLTSAEVVDLVEATEPFSARFGEHPDLASAEALANAECISHPDMIGVVLPLLPAEPDTAAQARALHARRELHQALDYGFALLDALDLSPRGLDIIDGAIARLDAMDAPGEDLEDEGLAEDGGDLEAVNEDGDPLDHGERDGWRRPRRARVERTEWPVAMAEREAQRLTVIAAVVTSPNVVRFPGRRTHG